ncbi:MAG TPA: exopolysaccharide biosynthesis polyprenyl glycosylphosphotransferase, partial [Dehalococcoidia bacterium]|nr:exopolysaccharide biosynthesis polyprenyl glycosylphosphotransferase [Dehalococcoidia bacterium]
DDPEKLGTVIEGVPVLGPTRALSKIALAEDVAEVILALPHYADTNVAPAVIRAYESGIRVTRMADLYEAATGRVPIQREGSYWYADLPLDRQPSSAAFAVKRCVDVAVALVGLVVLALVLPAAAVAIKLSSPGPIFYRQVRIGRLGRPFSLVKFRSMVVEAEQDGRARLAQRGDPRATRLGRLMRRSRFDELPQFWSVLRGDMSLVGPRPERPEVGAILQGEWAAFRSRLLVKPGLTGWSQVNMSYASTQEQMLPKLQYDLYYIKHWSLLLDFLILVRTVGVVLRLSGT